MSRRHHDACGCMGQVYNYSGMSGYGMGKDNCTCNFSSLVILILIILQFGGKKSHGFKVDNGILFIIALFFLSCNSPCKKWY